jgi:hypothetical protein
MRNGGGSRIGLLVVVLAALAGCKASEDQRAAVDACKRYGNGSEQCRMANRMLSSGAPKIAQALEAEEQARQAQAQRESEAKAREQQLAAQGVDPCEALHQKLAADHPAAACAPKIGEAVDWLKDDPGCAAALEDPEGTALTAADLLGECDTATE